MHPARRKTRDKCFARRIATDYRPAPMQRARFHRNDPIVWCALIALGFLALAWHRLGIPSKIYFDEVHYVKAARKLLTLTRANPEHPMVGKEVIAAAIAVLGDRPLNWRIPSLLFGTAGLFAFGRMLWLLSGRRFATIAGMLLLVTSFAWFIQSRIAMLDMIMAGFGMVALWQFVAATQLPAQSPPTRVRWRLALCGVCLGLALGSKWSVAPVAALPGMTFLLARIKDHGLGAFFRSNTQPVAGISLIEAALWLGALPLAVYWLSYLPAAFYAQAPIDWTDPIGWHVYMLKLQDSVVKLHPYRSVWYQWAIDWRSVWYLYEKIDGAQRGIVLIGNPLSMWAGLPALGWCLWAGLFRRRTDALALAVMYLLSMLLWIVSTKPIQFYYHYLLPGSFLMGCLALALDALWTRGGRWRWVAAGSLAAAIAVFAWFYPIISAAALHEGRKSYVRWMWLHSWR
ncbi:MAG: phospholipid carrier-dependent glycosyltransferase [Novosphingobium sp.]